MSKISDYQEQVRKNEAEEEARLQTVNDFAAELRKSTESLLKQLEEAGVPKLGGSDFLTHKDKAALLRHLQMSQGVTRRRKKITLTNDSAEKKLIRRAAKQENGAEFETLRHFSMKVLVGDAIEPDFQKTVNLIVAKAVFIGALPPEKLGRPKREELDSIGLEAAHRYWQMIDSGIRYEQAVEILSGEFHKSERHIMRLIAKHKKSVGDTPEIRTEIRKRNDMMRDMYRSSSGMLDHFKALYEPKVPVPELSLDDYLEHLEELISEVASRATPLTKKI